MYILGLKFSLEGRESPPKAPLRRRSRSNRANVVVMSVVECFGLGQNLRLRAKRHQTFLSAGGRIVVGWSRLWNAGFVGQSK